MTYFSNPYDTPVVREIADTIPRFSSSQRKIAFYILENIFEVATGGIEDLAAGVGVSTASISRFVSCINYTSFSNFKQALLQAFRPPFVSDSELPEPGFLGIAGLSFKHAALAVQKTEQFLSVENLECVINLLSQARTVYCMALGSSLPVANIASICLAPYCNHVRFVEGGGEVAVYRLNKISEEDLFIIFSFPRYSVDSVRFARFVRKRKARVLAITDQPGSPLVPLSDLALYTSSGHSKIPVSLVGAVALVEALTSALVERFPEKFADFSAFSQEFVPFHYFEYSRFNDDESSE